MRARLKPAVATAAAWTYATGGLPKGIQSATRGALFDVAPYTPGVRSVAGVLIGAHVIADEYLAEVRSHPLAVAADLVRSAGGRFNYQRNTTHYATAVVPSVGECHVYRSGGGGFRADLGRTSAPYSKGCQFSDATARAYLAAQAPAGAPSPRVAWPAWQALALELCEQRYSDDRPAYVESDAMTWHASGRHPFEYAAHAMRLVYSD